MQTPCETLLMANSSCCSRRVGVGDRGSRPFGAAFVLLRPPIVGTSRRTRSKEQVSAGRGYNARTNSANRAAMVNARDAEIRVSSRPRARENAATYREDA